jgi:hypothetical protein
MIKNHKIALNNQYILIFYLFQDPSALGGALGGAQGGALGAVQGAVQVGALGAVQGAVQVGALGGAHGGALGAVQGVSLFLFIKKYVNPTPVINATIICLYILYNSIIILFVLLY